MSKKIVVFGSSIASGWVTSREKQYDMQNGWAFRLERLLKPQGWEIINSGVPGDNTDAALKRIEKDLLELKPTIAIISLSLGNEGIGIKTPDELIKGYLSNLKIMIDKCLNAGIKPVIGYCYGSNGYSKDDFEVIKHTNLELNKLNLPLINLLGAFSDDKGHFPAGHNFDEGHPDNFGHEEMFLSIVPSLFESILTDKKLPTEFVRSSFVKIGRSENIKKLNFVADAVYHSFSVAVETEKCQDLQLMIQCSDGFRSLVFKNGDLAYLNNKKTQDKCKLGSDKFKLVLVHSHAMSETSVFINGNKLLSINEKLEPINISLTSQSIASCRNLLIYRSALNQDEVSALQKGTFLGGSLEMYSPLDNNLKNLAFSSSVLTLDAAETQNRINLLQQKIIESNIERNNTPLFKDKTAISLNESEIKRISGAFLGEQCGEILIEQKSGKIILSAFGNQAEILAETASKFFIRHPYEITVTFDSDYSNIDLNFAGQHFLAKRKLCID